MLSIDRKEKVIMRNAALVVFAFVEGAQKNSRIVNVPIIDGTGRTLYIGCAHSDQPFHGMIDDVRIYNRPLTEEEIHRLSAER